MRAGSGTAQGDDHVDDLRRQHDLTGLKIRGHAFRPQPSLTDRTVWEGDGHVPIDHAVQIDRLHVQDHDLFLAEHEGSVLAGAGPFACARSWNLRCAGRSREANAGAEPDASTRSNPEEDTLSDL